MKRMLITAVVAALGLAPIIGVACEYGDAAMASTDSARQLGLQPAPEASKAPAPVVAKAPAPDAAKQKQAQAKAVARPTDAKLAAANNP